MGVRQVHIYSTSIWMNLGKNLNTWKLVVKEAKSWQIIFSRPRISVYLLHPLERLKN